ncbi:hypothetical protein D3C72_1683940 [compost metagenome]
MPGAASKRRAKVFSSISRRSRTCVRLMVSSMSEMTDTPCAGTICARPRKRGSSSPGPVTPWKGSHSCDAGMCEASTTARRLLRPSAPVGGIVRRVAEPSKATSITLSSSDSAWNSAVRWLKRSRAAGVSFFRFMPR